MAEEEPLVRAYAHCTKDRPGAITVVALNLAFEPRVLRFEGPASQKRQIYLLESEGERDGDDTGLASRTLTLNGRRLLAPNGDVPAIPGELVDAPAHEPWLEMPALSYAFVVFPEADAPACR